MMPLAIFVLALGIFVINTSEFVIMGLLPEVAESLSISVPTAGYLISGYAIGVVLGAPLLTPFLVSLARKRVLVALMLVFTLGNLACALVPSYQLMLVARILTALAQATFFGLGAVVATQLVPADRAARAISAVFLGSTIANMFGSPAGTALGQMFGWRATFVVLAAVAGVTVFLLMAFLPKVASQKAPNLRVEFSVLRRPEMVRALLITALGFGGTFTTFTFITPILTEVTGLPSTWVSPVLLLFGFGMFLGNPLGGRLADWNVNRAVQVTLLGLIVVLGLSVLAMPNRWLMIGVVVLFGMALFATIPPLQIQVMSRAGDAPVLASAFNIAAFNLGNAAGAWLGGRALEGGLGYQSLPLLGAAMCTTGLLLSLLRERSPAAVTPTTA